MRSTIRRNRALILKHAAYFVVFLCLAVFLQVKSGVYRSELAHYPDEPAHIVSTLMIHDYLLAGLPHPMRYAENYYLHYPKVAIGWWPPMFHILGGFWLLIFSVSHRSLLMFMAVQAALVALLVAYFARRSVGPFLAFLAGILFLTFYIVQYDTSMFMIDLMVTVMDLISTLFLIRFFKTERTLDAVWFGLAASAGLLTKPNCIAIVLIPAFMIIFLRRWSILKKPGLYVSVLIVIALGLPWQFATMRMRKGAMPLSSITPAHFAHLLTGYVPLVVESTGYLVPLIAAAGLVMLRWGKSEKIPIEIVALGAMAAAVAAFHVFLPLPDPETRFLTPLFAAIAVFFVIGAKEIADALSREQWRRWLAPAFAVVCLAVHLATNFKVPPRGPMGYLSVVDALDGPGLEQGVILVSADGYGEGALVSEIALRDHRPARFVLRGSKVISEGRWGIRVHDSLLKTSDQLQEYLLSVPVDAVVVDLTAPLWQQDTDLVLNTMRDNPRAWRLDREIPANGFQHDIRVYRYTGTRNPDAKRDIQLRMRFTLGRDLKL